MSVCRVTACGEPKCRPYAAVSGAGLQLRYSVERRPGSMLTWPSCQTPQLCAACQSISLQWPATAILNTMAFIGHVSGCPSAMACGPLLVAVCRQMQMLLCDDGMPKVSKLCAWLADVCLSSVIALHAVHVAWAVLALVLDDLFPGPGAI